MIFYFKIISENYGGPKQASPQVNALSTHNGCPLHGFARAFVCERILIDFYVLSLQ